MSGPVWTCTPSSHWLRRGAALRRKTGCIVTTRSTTSSRPGEAVSRLCVRRCPVPVVRHGVEDVFGRSGKAERVLEHFGLSPEGIAAKVRQALELKK